MIHIPNLHLAMLPIINKKIRLYHLKIMKSRVINEISKLNPIHFKHTAAFKYRNEKSWFDDPVAHFSYCREKFLF